MSFNLKTYKCLKIKHYFKRINLFFFIHGTCLNNTNWIKTEQLLSKEELKYVRILNTLMIATVKISIFKNITSVIQGPLLILHLGNARSILKKLDSSNLKISLLFLKLNTKIYSEKQIKNLKELSYIKNVSLFYNSIRFVIKKPYYKFKSKKSI